MKYVPSFVRVSRHIKAAPDRLLDAFLKPELASKWLFTSPKSENNKTEMDPRVGGKWKVVDRRGGADYTGIGEYLEIVRRKRKRVVFTFGMPQFSDEFDLVVVEIVPEDEGSLLTLTQLGLPEGSEAPLKQGWEEMLDLLAAAA